MIYKLHGKEPDGLLIRWPEQHTTSCYETSLIYEKIISGTSDEHITVMENLRNVESCSAIIVTTPQEVAIEDVRKEITFCKKTGMRIMGIIENMSG